MKIRTPAEYREHMGRRGDRAGRARRTRPYDHLTEYMADFAIYDRRFRINLGLVGHRSKPDHASRAVNIRAYFPDAPKRRTYRPGSGASTHPTPLDAIERVANYQRQNGHRRCTNRQWQRIRHKEGRALARGAA